MTVFQRSPLTRHLVHWLEQAVEFPVGNAIRPRDSGWNKQQPNQPGGKGFVPYSVLTTMTATPAPGTGSIADPQADWHVPYMIQTFGATVEQAEALADKVRATMATLRNTILDLSTNDVPENRYKVQQAWVSTIGGVNVTPGADPMFYGEQDQFMIWLAKRIT